jgi:transglutaminase-like putative cysteine protease
MEHDLRRYRIRHVTRYRYEDEVEACYNRALLRPRDAGGQRLVQFAVSSVPEPELVSEHRDYFGNHSLYLETRVPAVELVVRAESIVEVDRQPPALPSLDRWTLAEAITAAGQATDFELVDFTLPSPLVAITEPVREFAAQALRPELGLGQALVALNAVISREFSYAKGATSVRTTLSELLSLRRGVCQDFAHLAAGCLRSVGLPARYVSGYLETSPPPGQAKLQGADATHAWVGVWTPAGWVDLDPTNDGFVDSSYVVTAWGRDFADVSPLRGVVFSEAEESTLAVEVDVERLPL